VPGQRRRAEMRVALAALVAAFTHGFALLLLVFVMAVGTLWAPPRTDAPDDRRRALWTLAPGLAVLALMWWRDRGFYPALEATPMVGYAGFADKLALPFLPTLLSRLGVDVAVAVALWLLLGAALLATLKTTTIDDDPVARRRLVLARVSVVMLAVGLLAPTRIGWFGSVDLRLCSTALLLAVLALAPAAFGPGLRRLLGRAPPLLAGVMVATLLVALVLFQAEARAPAAALARVPAGSVRPDLRLSPTSRVWAARAYLHWDKLLLLDRDVLISNPWLHQGTALRPAADHLRPAAGAAAARTPAPRSGW
jgi:hypothetical protein